MTLTATMYCFTSDWKEKKIDVEGYIKFCAEQKLEGVELVQYFWNDIDKEVPMAKRLCRDLNLPILSYDVGNNFAHADPKKREDQRAYVREGIDVAAELGAPLMRVFGGSLRTVRSESHHPGGARTYGSSFPEGTPRSEILKVVAEDLTECASYAEGKGITFAIENHGGIPEKSDEVFELLRLVDRPNVKALIDTGNFLKGGDDPVEATRKLVDQAVMVHLKDRDKKLKNGDWRYCILGQGLVDFNKIMAILKDASFQGVLSIEYEGELRTKGLVESIKYIRTLI
jgi:sugar phosphate isomerase/epimerase